MEAFRLALRAETHFPQASIYTAILPPSSFLQYPGLGYILCTLYAHTCKMRENERDCEYYVAFRAQCYKTLAWRVESRFKFTKHRK